MLLFSINFGSYFLILRGKLKGVLTSEIELFVLIVTGAVVCIAFNNADMFSSYSESFKHSFFSVASIISTTGFMSIDFDLWHEFSKSVIVILMLIGACAGSTGGGIKVSRIIIIFKVMGRELSTALRPKQVKKITIDGQVQDLSVVKAVYGYIFCFIAVFVISVLLISFEGYDLVTNFTSVAATVGNVGPGLEKVGPVMNYGFFSPFSKLVLCFDMLAGRLEFYPILLLFVPSTWRK
jgi:trk system potassium uptake protein TrkH